ncbi:MAG: hypothetical protein ACRDUW_15425 [Pseudonocardiaceae bacterium]
MMMVEPDGALVEAKLIEGGYCCVACGEGRLRRWGFARRRTLRDHGREDVVIRPRRGRCASCLVTHVLLPTVALLRRRDLAEVIGEALVARFDKHQSRATVAAGAGVVPDTARGWLRRFGARAVEIRVLFTAWAHHLDASLGAIDARGSPEADAVEAIGAAAAAAARRLGPAPPWAFVAGASGGLLLANTSCPLPAGP